MPKRFALFVLAAFALAGCNIKQPGLSPNQKAFEAEDAYALFALDAEANGHYAAAAQYFALLYEKAPRKAYREHFFNDLLLAKQYNDVLTNVEKIEQVSGGDPELERYRIRALLGLGKLDDAKKAALALVEKTKAKQDYVTVADIYAAQKHYDTALKYLESAYAIDFDENVLDKLAVMMYVNLDRKKDAIALLETHVRMNGCSERICKRLAGFYSDQNDIDGMLNTYLRLYDSHPDPQIAQAIIRIYSYQKAMIPLMHFLERSHADDDLLLKLYINAHEYAKAAELGERLYEREGDASYLGQSAIFQFEGAGDRADPKLLAAVVRKLETAVKSDRDPLLLNYLGYLLIDNDIDAKKGIRYVEQALEQEPDSPFYLDSLAWGYYKLGQCRKARQIMQKTLKAMGGEHDDELDAHVEAIERCLKRKPSSQDRP